ncbi:hypothetical protein COO60DRAFT_1626766 [Scenedesmus sp. NREL 46B-D3]|nr:hypothetical protein COO60DRAFT_1626766 [Scenedesmus sp. NREL 46B-D3]
MQLGCVGISWVGFEGISQPLSIPQLLDGNRPLTKALKRANCLQRLSCPGTMAATAALNAVVGQERQCPLSAALLQLPLFNLCLTSYVAAAGNFTFSSTAPAAALHAGCWLKRLRFHWWRSELTRTGRRPTSQEIGDWYEVSADGVWTEGKPSLQETRVHAKCLRSLPLVRDYFRNYRAKKKEYARAMMQAQQVQAAVLQHHMVAAAAAARQQLAGQQLGAFPVAQQQQQQQFPALMAAGAEQPYALGDEQQVDQDQEPAEGEVVRPVEADEVALLGDEQLPGLTHEALLAHVRAVQEELCGKRELLKRSFDQLRRTQERLGRRERKLLKEQQKCKQYQQALTAWQASLVPVAPDAAHMAQMAMAAQAAATTAQHEGVLAASATQPQRHGYQHRGPACPQWARLLPDNSRRGTRAWSSRQGSMEVLGAVEHRVRLYSALLAGTAAHNLFSTRTLHAEQAYDWLVRQLGGSERLILGLTDPLVSPMFIANFSGLVRRELLVVTGGCEAMVPDIQRFVARVTEVSPELSVTHHVEKHQPHCYCVLHTGRLLEKGAAVLLPFMVRMCSSSNGSSAGLA